MNLEQIYKAWHGVGADAVGLVWEDFVKALAAPVQQEPTKAMIDAAERIDWSDSDVRGNIVNMWQAMCAVAPQPAQQTCNCRWEGEVQVQQCTLHESHLLAIHEWAGRAKAAEAKLAEQPATVQHTALSIYEAIKHGDAKHQEWLRSALENIFAGLEVPRESEQPAQQEPCGWQFYQDGKWHNGMKTHNHRANTEAAGFPVRDVYPSPQPAQQKMTHQQAAQLINEMAEQPAQGTADDSELEAVPAKGGLLPAQQQEPVVRAAIVVNLVREGINKHRAKELADHFIGLAAPQPAQQQEARIAQLEAELMRMQGRELKLQFAMAEQPDQQEPKK